MKKKIIKKRSFLNLLLVALLLVSMLIPVMAQAATRVTVETKEGTAEAFQMYTSIGTWKDIKTPWHYIVNANGDTSQVAYCQQNKLPDPNSDFAYDTMDPESFYSPRTLKGIQIIMEHGYPSVQRPYGVSSVAEAHSATYNALRWWLSEETNSPNDYFYAYSNLKGANLEDAYNTCFIDNHIDARQSDSTRRSFRAGIRLLQAARAQVLPVHSLQVSPSAIEMKRDGDYYVGNVHIELQGIDRFEIDKSTLPTGTMIQDKSGNNISAGTSSMDVVIKVPRKDNAAKQIQFVVNGSMKHFPGNLLWVTCGRVDAQDMVYWSNETLGKTEASAKLNTPRYGWIEVEKRDYETGSAPQGDATLKGMKVEIICNQDIPEEGIKKGDVVQTLTLDGTTVARSKELPEGVYWLKEIEAPEGYVLNKQMYTTTVVADEIQKNHMTDIVIKAPISIIKFVEEPLTGQVKDDQIKTPEQGAKFEIRLNSSNKLYDTITTDKNGFAQSKALPYGTYTVTQVGGTPGYNYVAPFEVTIKDNTPDVPIPYIIENTILHNIVKIVKVDAESGEVIPQAGVKFKIKDSEGNWVVQKMLYPTPVEIDTFETAEDGRLTLPEPLRYGKYELHEVSSPEPYLLLKEPIQFEIADESVSEIEIVVENEIVKGKIDVHKTGEMFVGVKEEKMDDGTIVKHPVFEERPLAGVKLEIIAAEQIKSGDGVVHAEKGDIVQTIVTGETESNLSDELYLGRYIVREAETVDGYLLDKKEYEVELKYADDKTPLVISTTSIKNDRADVAIELLKSKEIFNSSGKYEYAPGEGFTFALVAKENLFGVDDEKTPLIKAGDIVSVAKTDKKGKAAFKDDVPYSAEYVVKEMRAPSTDYEINTTEYPVDLSFKQNTPILRVDINDGKSIKNDLIKVPVQISKTDITGEVALPGVTVEIYDDQGNMIYKGITLKDGKTEKIMLPVNRKFTYREVKTAEGYALNTQLMQFRIDEKGAIVGDMTIKNEVNRVILMKLDASTKQPLAGVKFGLYDKDGKLVMEAESQENGLVTFEKIAFGKFMIKEISTVPGYQISGQTIEIEITDTYQNPVDPVEVLNSPIVQTGIEEFPWLAVGLCAGGIAAALIIISVVRKRKA